MLHQSHRHPYLLFWKSLFISDVLLAVFIFLKKRYKNVSELSFSEISNLFESCGIGLEERPVICGYALEEARGKEFELATDYYISHYLPNLTSLRVVMWNIFAISFEVVQRCFL